MALTRFKHNIMAALLATFVSLFVLTSTAGAATCMAEPAFTGSADAFAFAAAPADTGSEDAPDDGVICSHCQCHCHQAGLLLLSSPESVVVTGDIAPNPLRPLSEPLTSRTPSGLERPPRA